VEKKKGKKKERTWNECMGARYTCGVVSGEEEKRTGRREEEIHLRLRPLSGLNCGMERDRGERDFGARRILS